MTINDLSSPAAFLQSRRSTPPAILGAPYPDREAISKMAAMAMRVPDHKKLEPWRLIALEGEALLRLGAIVREQAPQYEPLPEKAAKITALYEGAKSVVVLVFAPKEAEGAPRWEQHLSMGALGVSLVNAAIVEGFGACWMSGFLTECPEVYEFLRLGDGEKINGFVHLGTSQSEPPERPRPDLSQKLEFRSD